jgi:hypothetical protein
MLDGKTAAAALVAPAQVAISNGQISKTLAPAFIPHAVCCHTTNAPQQHAFTTLVAAPAEVLNVQHTFWEHGCAWQHQQCVLIH